MECRLEAFPPQVLSDLSRVVVQTHTEKRSRTQLLVDLIALDCNDLLATLAVKMKDMNVEGGSYMVGWPPRNFAQERETQRWPAAHGTLNN